MDNKFIQVDTFHKINNINNKKGEKKWEADS